MRIDPSKLPLLAEFKAPGAIDAYRRWASQPETAKYLALAADLVLPARSSPAERAMHSEAVACLVRKETAEEFMEACLRLEDFAMLSEDTGLPPSSYGAVLPVPPAATKPKRKAKPAQANP